MPPTPLPLRDKAFVLQVDEAAVVAGGTIVGSVAVNTKRSSEITVSLVRSVKSKGGAHLGGDPNRSNVVVATVTINPAGSPGSIPFALAVPEDATPGFTTTSRATASPTIERGWKVVATSGRHLPGSKQDVPIEVVADPAIARTDADWRTADATSGPHPGYESPIPALVVCLLGVLLALTAPFAADTATSVRILAVALVPLGIGVFRLRSTLGPYLTMRRGSPILQVGADGVSRGGRLPVRASAQNGDWEVRLVCLERYADRTAGRGGHVTRQSSRERAIVRQPLESGSELREITLPVPEAALPTSSWGPVSISWTVTVVPRGAAPWYIGRLALSVDVV